MIALKDYQRRVLGSLRDFLNHVSHGTPPSQAFHDVQLANNRPPAPYIPVVASGLRSEMPQCVPAGADFVGTLHQQVLQFGGGGDWTAEALIAWLDNRIDHADISFGESAVFLRKVLTGLMAKHGITDVSVLALDRFRLTLIFPSRKAVCWRWRPILRRRCRAQKLRSNSAEAWAGISARGKRAQATRRSSRGARHPACSCSLSRASKTPRRR